MSKKKLRILLDFLMTVLMLLLMAYQIASESFHEWVGIVMVVAGIAHQILNGRWYPSIFRGRYTTLRAAQTICNLLLLLSMAVTAASGMAMSNDATPFLRLTRGLLLPHRVHLAMSHWGLVFMGLHLGFRWGTLTAKLPKKRPDHKLLSAAAFFFAVWGLMRFCGMAFYHICFCRPLSPCWIMSAPRLLSFGINLLNWDFSYILPIGQADC